MIKERKRDRGVKGIAVRLREKSSPPVIPACVSRNPVGFYSKNYSWTPVKTIPG